MIIPKSKFVRLPLVALAAGAVWALAGPPTSAVAAGCPTVAEPAGLQTEFPHQIELVDLEKQTGATLTFSERPEFAAQVAAGTLPPVEQRLPEEPLVVLPYVDCGEYGGTLRGFARAYESGTSEILSWRQLNMVRYSDDMVTVVPNVAQGWTWNDDYTEVTFHLRKGHKWSDGKAFTADDVTFWANDIINNKEIHKETPFPWSIGMRAEKIDETTVKLIFDKPYPALLQYMSGIGSYFTPYANMQFLSPMHIKYNPDADKEAKAAGFDDWVARFGVYFNKWKDAVVAAPEGIKVPTLESHLMIDIDTQRRIYEVNPYYFKIDSSGQQLPYIEKMNERFVDKELWPIEIMNGNLDFKAQNMPVPDYPILKENEAKGNYTVTLPPSALGPVLIFNQTHKDPVLREIYADVRFRQAMSLAINRDEINELIFLGLSEPRQAVPVAGFTKPEDENYMIEYDPDRANALLDEMGLKRGPDGIRLRSDGKPVTILWEFSTQFVFTPEFPTLIAGWWNDVGINALVKEVTSQALREKGAANDIDIAIEWDETFEPVLISNVSPMVVPFSDFTPLMGVPWRDWLNSGGTSGEEPPEWAKRLAEIAEVWPTLVPGSAKYTELAREMVDIHLDNLIIIGTVGRIPKPNVVSNKLGNVPKYEIANFGYGYAFALRADQWYFKN
jgi:peptide/nickel transport system substrate-binding protein